MAPVKSAKVSTPSTSSQPSASDAKHKSKQKRKPNAYKSNPDAATHTVPGVQKIKAALRQTRRLLAKDKLAADVRVQTERRLRALENDLVEAQRVRQERKMATRYHKVKFFERQKVTRRLNQVKRQLEACSEKKQRRELEKKLFELRVDLNYIQYYPKEKKYISLFPPEVRLAQGVGNGAPVHSTASTIKGKAKEEQPDTDTQREEIRQSIAERMRQGVLNAEPETEVRANHHKAVNGTSGKLNELEPEAEMKVRSAKNVSHIDEDAFFGEDSEAEEEDHEDEDAEMD